MSAARHLLENADDAHEPCTAHAIRRPARRPGDRLAERVVVIVRLGKVPCRIGEVVVRPAWRRRVRLRVLSAVSQHHHVGMNGRLTRAKTTPITTKHPTTMTPAAMVTHRARPPRSTPSSSSSRRRWVEGISGRLSELMLSRSTLCRDYEQNATTMSSCSLQNMATHWLASTLPAGSLVARSVTRVCRTCGVPRGQPVAAKRDPRHGGLGCHILVRRLRILGHAAWAPTRRHYACSATVQ